MRYGKVYCSNETIACGMQFFICNNKFRPSRTELHFWLGTLLNICGCYLDNLMQTLFKVSTMKIFLLNLTKIAPLCQTKL